MRSSILFAGAVVLSIAALPRQLISQSAKELPCVGYAVFEPNGSNTELIGLAIGDVPAGSKVTLSCSGNGCPFDTKTINMKSSAGTLALTDMFLDKNLKPGTVLELRVTKPGWVGKLFQYEVRPSGDSRSSTQCISEDGSKIMACLRH
jgi:hypothetical protein